MSKEIEVILGPPAVAASGESNTSSNVGTGQGLALAKVGVNLPFKSIKATGSATISGDADSVTINVNTDGISTFTFQAATEDQAPPPASGFVKWNEAIQEDSTILYVSKFNLSGDPIGNLLTPIIVGYQLGLLTVSDPNNLQLWEVTTITEETNYFTFGVTLKQQSTTFTNGEPLTLKVLTTANTGQDNTTSNEGTGLGLAMPKDGVNLPFKTLKAGLNVNMVETSNEIEISASGTTAGLLSRSYYTGDETITTEGTFYTTAKTKGTVTSVNQTVTVNDNQKLYFAQDTLGLVSVATAQVPSGNYNAILSVEVTGAGGEQRFTIEVYLSDIDGLVIDSGITGAPVGDLGVKVLAILDSGTIDLLSGSPSQINCSGILLENFFLLTNQRVRYHVSGEKIGVIGSTIDLHLYFGSDYNSYIDTPVIPTTDSVINTSTVAGSTATNALETLDTEITNKENKFYPQDLISATPAIITTAFTSTTKNVYDVGALCVFNITAGCLSIGASFEVNVGDADGIEFSAGVGTNLFGTITGSTTVGDTVAVRRVLNDSFGLTGEVYKII